MRNKSPQAMFYLAPFLIDIAMGNVMIAVPLLAISLGESSIGLGILGFTPGIVYISLCFLFGKLSEKRSKKKIIISGSLFYVLACLMLSLSESILHLYLSMAMIGVGAAMFWPILESWLAEIESQKPLVQRMAFFNISWSAGLTLGPLIGGILFTISFKVPFYFSLMVSLMTFLILMRLTPQVKRKGSFCPEISMNPDPPKNFTLYINISRIANFTLWLSLGIIRYIFPKLGTELGISSSRLGFLIFIFSLSQTLTFYFLGITQKWHYRVFPLIFFQLLGVIGFLVIFITTSLWLFLLAFVLVGISIGMTHTSSLFYSVNVISQRGPSAALHETVLGTGGIFGPLLGGVIAQSFSLRTPYLVTALIIATGIFLQLIFYKISSRKIIGFEKS